MYTSGRGASAAGLTIGMIKTSDGRMLAMAGVLPLMSGGIAYVYDEHGDFIDSCNTDMVGLESVSNKEDQDYLRNLITDHYGYSSSSTAKKILESWDENLPKFIKVMPNDYKRVLQEKQMSQGKKQVNIG